MAYGFKVLADLFADRARKSLSKRKGRSLLKIAIGVAAPAIESWLLCSSSKSIPEATWLKDLKGKRDPYWRRRLKKRLYGTERPTLVLETEKMTEAARTLATKIDLLEKQFPIGFGPLAGEIRSLR